MPELILVKAETCHPLREAILRPGQPRSAWTYATDDDPRALHFAIKQGRKVYGVASLLPEARTDGGKEPWRLRGMAVLAELRGQGYGRMLLQAVQAVVQQRGGGVWCTARTTVEEFYRHYGFVREGEVFDLPGGGPHVLMSWRSSGPQRMKFGPEGDAVVELDDDAPPGGEDGDPDGDAERPDDDLPDGDPDFDALDEEKP